MSLVHRFFCKLGFLLRLRLTEETCEPPLHISADLSAEEFEAERLRLGRRVTDGLLMD